MDKEEYRYQVRRVILKTDMNSEPKCPNGSASIDVSHAKPSVH